MSAPNLALRAALMRSVADLHALDSLLESADEAIAASAAAAAPGGGAASSSSASSAAAAAAYSGPSNARLHAQMNRIIEGLARVEAAAGDASTRGALEPSLLEHLGDAELGSPDAWMQGRLGELVQGEKLRLLRDAAVASIGDALVGGGDGGNGDGGAADGGGGGSGGLGGGGGGGGGEGAGPSAEEMDEWQDINSR